MDHQLVGTPNISMLGQTSLFQSTLISHPIARLRQRSEAVRLSDCGWTWRRWVRPR